MRTSVRVAVVSAVLCLTAACTVPTETEPAPTTSAAAPSVPLPTAGPATFLNAAAWKLEGVGSIFGVSQGAVFAQSVDGLSLLRIRDGKKEWTSQRFSSKLVQVATVKQSSRLWVVAVLNTANGVQLNVFDSYSRATNEGALRVRTFKPGSKVVLSDGGVMVTEEGRVQLYNPDTGLVTPIALPPNTTAIAAFGGQLLLTTRTGFMLAGATQAWGAMNNPPPQGADGTAVPVGYGAGLIMAVWTFKGSKVLAAHDISTGAVRASTELTEPLPTTPGLARVMPSDNDATVGFENYVLDLGTQQGKAFKTDVLALVDQVAYIKGSAVDLRTGKQISASAASPVAVVNRVGIFRSGNDLYGVPLLRTPTATAPTTG